MIYRIWNYILGVKEDIENNLVNFLLVTIQMIALCFFSYFLVMEIDSYVKVKSLMTDINNKGDMYILYNNSESDEDEYIYRYKENDYNEFYQYIKSIEDLEFYIADSSMSSGMGGGKLIITENFLDIFSIDKKFTKSQNESSVIIGYNLKKNYKIGDYITDYRTEKKYYISDILDKGTYYVAPRESAHTICLDDYILFQYDDTEFDNISDIIFSIGAMTFLSDEKSTVDGIVNKASELGLYSYELQSYELRKEIMLSSITDAIENDTFVVCILIVFILIHSISFIIQYIANNRKNFAIYMICGSSKKYIILRIALRQIVSILIGISICVYEMGLSRHMFFLFIGFFVYMCLILIYPIYIINNLTVGNLLRRNNE